MSESIVIAILSVAGVIFTALGVIVGHRVADRKSHRETEASAQDKLVDQLQEELERYRKRTDARLDVLEAENRGYRAFIGIQRDHMAAHNIPLPPWPDGLPR